MLCLVLSVSSIACHTTTLLVSNPVCEGRETSIKGLEGRFVSKKTDEASKSVLKIRKLTNGTYAAKYKDESTESELTFKACKSEAPDAGPNDYFLETKLKDSSDYALIKVSLEGKKLEIGQYGILDLEKMSEGDYQCSVVTTFTPACHEEGNLRDAETNDQITLDNSKISISELMHLMNISEKGPTKEFKRK